MKYLSFTFILLAFHFASASGLDPSTYKAKAEGTIRLNTEEGTSLIGSGDIEMELERVNPLTSPIQFFKGAGFLVLKNDLDIFKFNIPSHSKMVNDQMTITAEESAQTADLRIKESQVLTNSTEEVIRKSCSYSGYCYTCEINSSTHLTSCETRHSYSCSGHRDVRYKVETFQRSFDVLISNGAQALQIYTQPIPENRYTEREVLTSCR